MRADSVINNNEPHLYLVDLYEQYPREFDRSVESIQGDLVREIESFFSDLKLNGLAEKVFKKLNADLPVKCQYYDNFRQLATDLTRDTRIMHKTPQLVAVLEEWGMPQRSALYDKYDPILYREEKREENRNWFKALMVEQEKLNQPIQLQQTLVITGNNNNNNRIDPTIVLVNENKGDNTEITRLKTQLAEKTAEIIQLQSNYNKLENDYKNLKSNYEKIEKRNEEMEKDQITMIGEVNRLKNHSALSHCGLL